MNILKDTIDVRLKIYMPFMFLILIGLGIFSAWVRIITLGIILGLSLSSIIIYLGNKDFEVKL